MKHIKPSLREPTRASRPFYMNAAAGALSILMLFSLLLFSCKKQEELPGDRLDSASDSSAMPEDTAPVTDAESDKESESDYTDAPESTDTQPKTEQTTQNEDVKTTKATQTNAPQTKAPETKAPEKTTSNDAQPPEYGSCKHEKTYIINKREADCEHESYSGDVCCAICHVTISNGTYGKNLGHDIQKVGEKAATTESEGYTGDWICQRCKQVFDKGEVIPKRKIYTATHDYKEIETEVLRLINEERAKEGLAALIWDEELYPGTKVRVNEADEKWGHTRPNGDTFISAIIENSNYTTADFTTWGENLAASAGYDDATEVAERLVKNWMESPGHRENILWPKYTHTAIAVKKTGPVDYIADNVFIGKYGR